MTGFDLGARALDKIYELARTTTDLSSDEKITKVHIAVAIGYHKLNRKL